MSAPTYPHVHIGEILKEIRHNDQGSPRKHVVILGGGMAGLAAAYELTQLGHTVEILEASHRTGGRVWSHHFSDGTYNELGAMRIPPSHDYTHYYIDKMGLKKNLIPFINSTAQGFWDIHNVITRNTASDVQQKIYPHFKLSETFRNTPSGGAIFGALLANVIATLTDAEVDSLFEGRMDTDYLRYLDNLSLGQFLSQNAGMDAKEVAGVFTSLEVWYDKSITMFIRDEIVGTGDKLVTIDGGMEQLPRRLTEKVKADVQIHREVVRIDRRDDHKVEIRVRDTKTGETTDTVADYVLCTIPFSVMRRMELEGLSYGKMRAIRNMAYAAASKVLLDCDQRFWQSPKYGIFGGSSISDHIQRQTYYTMSGLDASESNVPSKFRGLHTAYEGSGWTVKTKPDHDWRIPGAITGAYCWGRDARRLTAVGEDERRRVVVESIERYMPELGSHVVDSTSIAWEQYKWSAGAFAFFRPGDIELYYQDAIRPEGRLFFAGEHLSTDPAWIQGALIASLRAVNEIVSVR